MDQVEITAGGLHLRPFTLADAPRVFEICQDPENQRWTTIPSPYTAEDARSFTGEVVPTGWESGREAIFAICDSTSANILASVGLHFERCDDAGTAEVGFLSAPESRGRGVMTQAVGAVCRWGFDALGLGRIEWYAQVGNHASRRVAEKVGFQFEGVMRHKLVHRGERVDAWAAGLLPGDVLEVR